MLSARQGSLTQRGQHSPSKMVVYSQLKLGQVSGQQSTSPSCGEKAKILHHWPYAQSCCQSPRGGNSQESPSLSSLTVATLHHYGYDVFPPWRTNTDIASSRVLLLTVYTVATERVRSHLCVPMATHNYFYRETYHNYQYNSTLHFELSGFGLVPLCPRCLAQFWSINA